MGTLKLPKETNPNSLQTSSIILKLRPTSLEFRHHLSQDDDSPKQLLLLPPDDIDACEESYFNQHEEGSANGGALPKQLWKKQRRKFEDIDKMDQDSETKRKAKEIA